MVKAVTLLIVIFFCISKGQSLDDSIDIKTDEVMSDLLQQPSDESDNSDLYDTIEEFISNPVNLNEAGLIELVKVPFMDITTANRILKHREKFGHFFSVYELYSIEDLSKNIIEKVYPFLTVNKKTTVKGNSFFSNSSYKLRSKIQNDLQIRKGFAEKKFAGSGYKVYNRFTAGFNNLELGFLTDKDPGESSITDFSSYFLSIKKTGFINNIILGDYLIKWGQGLALWSPYGFSKGADAVFPVKKNSKTISRYASASESNFFRGTALNLGWKNFCFTAFYSRNRVDANVDSVTQGILSAPIDGLHRTENELAKKSSTSETVFGSAIDFHSNYINSGILFYNSSFGNSFIPGSIYDIKGKNFNYTSFFFDLLLKNINLFGEMVYDGISVASINGIEIQACKELIFLAAVRNYPKDFNNIHGFSFGEKSGTSKNEFGIYYGIRWNSPAGLFNFYFDQFKFPYASYRMPLPSTGHEFLLDYKNKFIKNFETGIRFKYENKEITLDENGLTKIGSRVKKISRVELNYKISKQVGMRGRFEYNNITINRSTEEGFLIFQDIHFNLFSSFNFYTRIAFFRTDSFNSAVYEYENDLPGTLISSALFGEGIRWYFVVRIKPYNSATISCKYSETYKPKENSLGSALLEIDGNLDNRFSIQLDFNY
ncbi:MAG: helix-hairpin-helix domain-containing protein [Ignavibacteriaceae bacterium]